MTNLAVPIDALVAPLTAEDALETSLEVAATEELPTTSWVEGDPVLTLIEILSWWMAHERELVRLIVAGGWLDYAEGEWLTVTAKQVFNVDRIPQDFATVSITLTNGSSETWTGIGAEDITVENTSTGKTYRNLDVPAGGTVAPGVSVPLVFIADEAGSESSADAGEIDNVVTGLPGATCTNASAAVGRDEESDPALRARCRLKVPAISRTAAGPKGKYVYVAITPSENGGADVTRAEVFGSTVTGAVEVVIANAAGAPSSDDRDLVEEALVDTVIGPTETLTVSIAATETIAVTYTLWIYDDENRTEAEVKAAVSTRLGQLFAVAPIGGWKKPGDGTGYVFVNLLEATIKSVSTRAFQVEVALPAANEALAANAVPVLGTVTGTVHFVTSPSTGGTL